MLKNYIKIAFRNLTRYRSYTIINVAGLALGIAICIVIFSLIRFESSFDNFHSKKDRIYRVLTEYHHADASEIFYGYGVPRPMPAALRSNFSQLEKVAPIYTEGNDQILVLNEAGEAVKKFKEEKGVFFTETSFFQIFDFPFLAGNPSTALRNPNDAILTKEIAEKYFGNWKNAMGKSIKRNNEDVLKITGILADIPSNSDFQLKVIISYGTSYTASFLKSTDWDGTGTSFGCYILASPNFSASAFNNELRAYSRRMKSPENKDSHIIQPLSKVHSDTKTGNYSGKTMSKQLINILWLIAGFILLIACVNFINLSTAQAVNRAKEVGVRKVMGSNKWQLRVQFLCESFLIVVASVIIGLLVAIITIPFLGRLLEIPVILDVLSNPTILLFLLLLTLIVTALAGFYPSMVLSALNPINALKNKQGTRNRKGVSLRQGLVTFQFIIAQALIIGTLIIIKQMNYFNSQPLGFNRDAIVNIPLPYDSLANTKLDYLRNELLKIKGVQKVCFSSNTPVEDEIDNWSTFTFDHAQKETDFYAIQKWTDHEYLPTYQIPLVAGRNLRASDTTSEFLVNETLVKNLGISNPQDALNKEISMWNGNLKGVVVGVLKDFHDRSFRRDLAPVLMSCMKRGYGDAGIKLSMQDANSSINAISKLWGSTFPDFVFEHKFLDDKIESFYRQENKLAQLYKIFAVIAILISCLGLYGLASFMAVQRIKELGIRKVLGATATSIVYLFSKEFMILIGIAFLIAAPIAWYFMKNWLEDYVYRISINPGVFVAGGGVALLIALVTVSFKSIRAALANPVKSLRTE